MTICLPARLLRTDAGRAAVTVAWLQGATQKRLAHVFGHTRPTAINIAVMSLIRDYVPECLQPRYDYSTHPKDMFPPQREARRIAALAAVRRYMVVREP